MKPARDIAIRHCTLRVTRRGGWSWGADAQTLTRRAIERLPALLERRLGELGDTLPDDLEIAQPLCLRVALRAQEWAELIGSNEPNAQGRARLEAALDAAMTQVLPAALSVRLGEAESHGNALIAPPAVDVKAATPAAVATTQPQSSALWKLLVQWRGEGKLLAQIAQLREVVLRLWLERLLEVESTRAPATIEEAQVHDLWREVCALPLLLPAGSARSLARKLIFTLALKARWAPGSSRTRELVARFCADDSPAAFDAPLAAARSAEAAGLPGASALATRSPTTDAATVSAHGAPASNSAFEVDIPCALPFLLLTPLARCGYLATLAATLEAANASRLAAGVALGLAHKCLAPPQRGWLRDAGALTAAAAFAAQPSCYNELVLNAGGALRPQLAVLDACVTDQLIRGHRPKAAWLLAPDASGTLVLFDEDELVPVATAPFATLAARIAPSGSVLFVPARSSSSDHLDRLDDLQIPYASDGDLASRASATSFVARNGAQLWVSCHRAQQGRARGIAGRGTALAAEALANWNALHEERPAQRPDVDPAFETSLSLATGYALSAIAWTLWRQRSRATALAAIENFGDLDARVHITPERVHVTLPMGRRAWDLRDHGLLADVRDVPWLGERTVIFGVG